jgi:hypothetical protein
MAICTSPQNNPTDDHFTAASQFLCKFSRIFPLAIAIEFVVRNPNDAKLKEKQPNQKLERKNEANAE